MSRRKPRKKVYLAGPEVFLPDPQEIARRKKAICDRYDFDGKFPTDNAVNLEGLRPSAAGLRISEANSALMRQCDLLVANMTPFRGPNADVGTAYEMGFMRALGRPVFAYSNVTEPYLERIGVAIGRRQLRGHWVDPADMLIEDHDMADNLMLEGGVLASGARVVLQDTSPGDRFTDLIAFEECVQLAKRVL